MTHLNNAHINTPTSYVNAMGTRIILWIVGSMVAVGAAAFASARFMH